MPGQSRGRRPAQQLPKLRPALLWASIASASIHPCPWLGTRFSLARPAEMHLMSLACSRHAVGSCCGVLGWPQRPFFLADGDVCAFQPLREPLCTALSRTRATGVQGLSLFSSSIPFPGPPVLQSSLRQPPPGDGQLFRLLLGSWVLFLQIIYLGLHRGVDTTLLGVFSFPESSGASRAPRGFLTQTWAPWVQASPFFPQRISCNHPGVSVLKSRSFGVFRVSLWEFLFCWRFCFVVILVSTCKANIICFILDVSNGKTLPHDG